MGNATNHHRCNYFVAQSHNSRDSAHMHPAYWETWIDSDARSSAWQERSPCPLWQLNAGIDAEVGAICVVMDEVAHFEIAAWSDAARR